MISKISTILVLVILVISVISAGCSDKYTTDSYELDYRRMIDNQECQKIGMKPLEIYSKNGKDFIQICYHDSPYMRKDVNLD